MLADIDSRSKGTVLLLAFHFPPSNTSGATRPFRFYKYLPSLGYGVQVLTASKPVPNDVQPNVICLPDNDQEPGRSFPRMSVHRLLRYIAASESLSWSFRAGDTAEQVFSQERICAVLSTSSPTVSHIVAARFKHRYGIPWIADFRDPMAGDPFRKQTGITGYMDRAMQKWIFRRADALIATTDATVELWQRQHPEQGRKMHLIWNGFDPEDMLTASPIPERKYKLLVHAGTLYGPRHPGVLLCALHRLIQRGLLSPKKLLVRLIGASDEGWSRNPQQVEELVRLGCLQHDGRRVSTEEARQAVAGADGLILLDSHAEGGAVQLPAKIFDYVRIGRPILAITTHNSPADRLLARSGIPYCAIYPEDTPEEVDQKVILFLELPSEPIVASEWFWKEFDAGPQVQKLASLIDALVAGTANPSRSVAGRGNWKREFASSLSDRTK
jgi:glycosyltransferase involved in cell wall biosynthesis